LAILLLWHLEKSFPNEFKSIESRQYRAYLFDSPTVSADLHFFGCSRTGPITVPLEYDPGVHTFLHGPIQCLFKQLHALRSSHRCSKWIVSIFNHGSFQRISLTPLTKHASLGSRNHKLFSQATTAAFDVGTILTERRHFGQWTLGIDGILLPCLCRHTFTSSQVLWRSKV